MLNIQRANQGNAEVVAELVESLLVELGAHADNRYLRVSRDLLTAKTGYTVFLASTESNACVGMVSVSESCAVYTLGKFGIIHELYVRPEHRSSAIGHQLIGRVIAFAREMKWTRLEVATPEPKQWHRTVAFYKREGFQEGGTVLKYFFE